MAGNITFVNGQGGLGRPLAGEDFISGLLYYTATLPSGYSSSDRIKKFFSVADAENAGITNTYSDATAAVAKWVISAYGATGDTVTIKVTEPNGVVVNLFLTSKRELFTLPSLKQNTLKKTSSLLMFNKSDYDWYFYHYLRIALTYCEWVF